MHTIAERADGARLIFDHDAQDARGDVVVYAYVQTPDGTVYPSQPLEQVLARGYWEAIGDNLLKSLVPGLRKFNENHDELGRFSTGDGSGSSTSGPREATAAGIREQINQIKSENNNAKDIPALTLKGIIKDKGFDGKPQIVASEKDLQGTILYRGVMSNEKLDASEMAHQFAHGEMYVGLGVHGNGVYFATERYLAGQYAYGHGGALAGQGAIITGSLPPESKILEYDVMDYAGMEEKVQSLSDAIPRDIFAEHIAGGGDISKIAALNGYDAVHIVNAKKGDQYIVLNRGAMQVVGK